MDYHTKLRHIVIDNSHSLIWEEAKKEWNASIQGTGDKTCICGKKHIKYLFSLKHKENQVILQPVGSCCIKHFNEAHMNYIVRVSTWGSRLLRTGFYKGKTFDEIIQNHQYIEWLRNHSKKKYFQDLVFYYDNLH